MFADQSYNIISVNITLGFDDGRLVLTRDFLKFNRIPECYGIQSSSLTLATLGTQFFVQENSVNFSEIISLLFLSKHSREYDSPMKSSEKSRLEEYPIPRS